MCSIIRAERPSSIPPSEKLHLRPYARAATAMDSPYDLSLIDCYPSRLRCFVTNRVLIPVVQMRQHSEHIHNFESRWK